MPIELPPISRKEFLKRALVLGAGLAFAPGALAASRRVDADSWALLADTHIAADEAHVVRNTTMAANLKAITGEVLAMRRRPAGAFIVGDCALSDGKTEEYATLGRLIEPLRAAGIPLRLALGNHDHRARFWEAFAAERDAQKVVADRQVALIETPRLNWLMLDSLEVTLQTPGALGAEQLMWLERTLDANPDKPAALVVHHNPGTAEKIIGLKDTTPLLEVIRPRRQVKAWFFGHTHHWEATRDESGIHLVNLPPAAYIFKEGNPSGWVHATTRARGMKLELRCVDAKHPEHGREVDLEWRK